MIYVMQWLSNCRLCEICGRAFLDLFWVVAEAIQTTWKCGFLLFCYVCTGGIAIKMELHFDFEVNYYSY